MPFKVRLSCRFLRQVVQHNGWLRISMRVDAPGEDEREEAPEDTTDTVFRSLVRPLLRFLDKGHLDPSLLQSARVCLRYSMIRDHFIQGGRRSNQGEAFSSELA